MAPRPRLACLRFAHLALRVVLHAHPELAGEPVVVRGPGPGGTPVVVAASAAAAAAGAVPGQAWRQAVLACPAAAQVPVDQAAVTALRRAALAALGDHSPLVEWTDDTTAFVDLSGRHPRHATEGAWAAAGGRALAAVLGEPPAVGVASSRFTAEIAARAAGPGRIRRVAPGGEAAFLAPRSVGVLPLPGSVIERLRCFGLPTCGACAGVPAADLQRQFGPDGLRLHQLTTGRDPAHLRPWREPVGCGIRRVLAGAVADWEALRFGAADLADQLAGALRARARAAGRLRLVLRARDAPDGPVMAGTMPLGVWWAERALPWPVATSDELLPPILGLLGGLRPTEPVAVIELVAADLQPLRARQVDLWHQHDADREAIVQAVARLHDRFGTGLVWRVALRPDAPEDLPERRLAWRAG